MPGLGAPFIWLLSCQMTLSMASKTKINFVFDSIIKPSVRIKNWVIGNRYVTLQIRNIMTSIGTITNNKPLASSGILSHQNESIEMTTIRPAATDHSQDNPLVEDEVPDHATSAIPDGGYGWTIVASCFILLFWINGYTTAWGVLQAAIVQSPRLHTNIRTITFVGSLYMACMVAFGLASVRLSRQFGIRFTSLTATILFGAGLIITSFTLEHLAGLFCVAGLLVGLSTSLDRKSVV